MSKEVEEPLTRQRQIVLEVIRSNGQHLTANEVFDASRKGCQPSVRLRFIIRFRYLKDAG